MATLMTTLSYSSGGVSLFLGDGLLWRPPGWIIVTDPPMDMDLPDWMFINSHLLVHPHIIYQYPPTMRHVSAWLRRSPGIERNGFGHQWNALLHYGPADLPMDVFYDDEPRVTDHPAERGVGPLTELIQALPPGPIYDPFCGTGSVLLAARRCGRKALGAEINQEFAEMARRRLVE